MKINWFTHYIPPENINNSTIAKDNKTTANIHNIITIASTCISLNSFIIYKKNAILAANKIYNILISNAATIFTASFC